MSRWICVAFSDLHLLPRAPAVYAVYVDGKPVYIGQSQNVRARWHAHRHDTRWGRRRDAYLKVRPVRRFGDHLATEARLIRRLRPIHNRHVPTPPKPEDIARRVSRTSKAGVRKAGFWCPDDLLERARAAVVTMDRHGGGFSDLVVEALRRELDRLESERGRPFPARTRRPPKTGRPKKAPTPRR